MHINISDPSTEKKRATIEGAHSIRSVLTSGNLKDCTQLRGVRKHEPTKEQLEVAWGSLIWTPSGK